MRDVWWLLLVLACKDGDGTDEPNGTTGDSAPLDACASAPVDVSLGGQVVCADPSARLDGPYERRASSTPPNSDLWIWAGGEMAGDFNGDGWLDLMAPNELGMELYEGGPGGALTPRGQQVLSQHDLSFGTGGSVVDYDGDGDLDVYVTRFRGDPGPDGGSLGRNRLLRNQGDGTFDDVTDAAGVDGCGYDANTGTTGCYRTMSSSWGDIDADGDLDLFVGNYGWVDESGVPQEEFLPAEPSMLYLNDGDGTFTDVSERLPQVLKDGYTYAGGFFDLDGDGDLDIYTVNDFGKNWPNHPLLNRGDGTFDDDLLTNATGMVLETTGMGLGVGDLNGDGLVDLVIPAWNKNHLLMSSSFGAIDYADTLGVSVVAPQKVGWGSEMGDVDNDGDLDILMQYGHVANENPVWENPLRQPDALYLNVGTPTSPTFDDVGVSWGVADPGVERGGLLVDLNRDGWLDITKRNLDGPNVAYFSVCGDASWLTLHLKQPGTMNTQAVGAKVVVEAGGLTLTRWVHAGGTGYGSGLPPELHFGLGDAEVIDRVTVTWPDGCTSVVEDVAARQQVTLTR
jgi:hypothetical protein